MSALVLIQARLGSSRLPGKVLAEIGGHTALEHVVQRAIKAVGDHWSVAVACPEEDFDALGERAPWVIDWDGPENDVLGRLYHAYWVYTSVQDEPDAIVRLTADCPFVDVLGIRAVATAVGTGQADYAATFDWRDGGPQLDGLDAEAFTPELLTDANDETTDPDDREHVTPWMQRNAENPLVVRPTGETELPPYRWTLDTPADLMWFRQIAETIDVEPPDHPTWEELHDVMEQWPELRRMSGETEVVA